MQNRPVIFSSNRVEILYERLKQDLYKKGDFAFARRRIVVPNASMKDWLSLRLADDPECTIAAGIEVCYLDQVLRLFYQKQECEPIYFASEIEWAFLIEARLRRVLDEESGFSDEAKALWKPALNYLKSERRLVSLSSLLARLFVKYGRFGNALLDKWESGSVAPNWQALLWRDLKRQNPHVDFLYRQLAKISEKGDGVAPLSRESRLYLFALSFIPAQAQRFLVQAASSGPIRQYLLSPCQVFWSDICSDKERIKQRNYWKKKGASESQQQLLDRFLRERNSLLGNFGRPGREMAELIEQSEAEIEECYRLPALVRYIPYYEEAVSPDMTFDSDIEPVTLLHAIQADMALLRNPNDLTKLEMPSDDRSIQLHVSYTEFREVENLYNILVHLSTKHAEDASPITPGDMIVMVPDLSKYESTIRSVFGSPSSVLQFRMMETRFLKRSSLVRGLFHLIGLASGRMEADEVLRLLDYPEFARKQGFSQSDVRQIHSWVEHSGVYWGNCPSHRDLLLANDYGESCRQADGNPSGTWEHGLKRLLMSTVIETSGFDDRGYTEVQPIEGMETSRSELLEKWLGFMRAMQKDLKPISDGIRMELKKWSSYLELILESYFAVDPVCSEEEKIQAALLKMIRGLASSPVSEKERFSFLSVHSRLTEGIDAELETFGDASLRSVRFCSPAHMRAIPAKVIVLLGMSEGSFPRHDSSMSLDELGSCSEADYAPGQADFDRYLFLEALLSARRYFVLSYVGYSFDEQSEVSASLPVRELFEYLDRGYTVESELPSRYCLYRHPFDSFDKSYFDSEALFPSYIPEHYRAAQAHYSKGKHLPHAYYGEFSPETDETAAPEVVITLRELSTFASNPLKTYFNKNNVYINNKEDSVIQSEEPFVISNLENYRLRIEGVKNPPGTVLNKADRNGLLPKGMFKTLSSESLVSEIEKMHRHFAANQVKPGEIASIHFVEDCETPELDENGDRILPPLQITLDNGCKVKIIGTLKDVCPQGLIFHRSRDAAGVFKMWPQFLILCEAIKRYDLPVLPQLLSSKDSKPVQLPMEESLDRLKAYLRYYFSGAKVPSLLIPEWIPHLLKEDPVPFSKAMRSGLEGTFSPLYNDYALWLFRDLKNLPSPELLHAKWRPISLELFDGIKI